MFPCVTTFLEIFLLIGLSSHLSKLLIVYTEIIQLPRVKHIKETVVCIITGRRSSSRNLLPPLPSLAFHLTEFSVQVPRSWLCCATSSATTRPAGS